MTDENRIPGRMAVQCSTMPDSSPADRVATLWQLVWDAARLSCVVYRRPDGLHLVVESATAVIVTERFDLRPRALSRARALRASLKRRGWQDAPSDTPNRSPDGTSP